MLGLDIGNPELFNRHASSEHMVKVGVISCHRGSIPLPCICHVGNSLCRTVSQPVAVLPQ